LFQCNNGDVYLCVLTAIWFSLLYINVHCVHRSRKRGRPQRVPVTSQMADTDVDDRRDEDSYSPRQ